MSIYTLTALAILSNAGASVLLKIFNQRGGHASGLLEFATIGYVGSALLFYVMTFVVYTFMLETLPVSRAYVVMTIGAQILLVLAGVFLFGESLTLTGVIGMVLLFVGICMVTQGVKGS